MAKHSGNVKWTYDIKQDGREKSFHGDPLAFEDLIIVGTDLGTLRSANGHVYAFKRVDGSTVWKFPGAGFSSNIVIDGNRVYALDQNGTLTCLEARTGRAEWHFSVTGSDDRYLPGPVLANEILVVPSLNDGLYGLDAISGKELWHLTLPSDSYVQLACDPQSAVIFAVSENQRLYRLDARSGRILAQFDSGKTPIWKPSGVDRSLLAFFADGSLARFAEMLGRPSWTAQVSSQWTSQRPYVFDDEVITADSAGMLSAYSFKNGSFEWEIPVAKDVVSMRKENEFLYLGTTKGIVSAIRIPK